MICRPNILMVMADQLTAKVLSFHGAAKPAKTPNIDRLAAEGHVLQNTYCPFPICAPSRQAMLTGKLASEIGVYDNGAEFCSSHPTFVHHLRNDGYYTALSGKAHFVGADQLHGYEDRLTTDAYPADLAWTPRWDEDAEIYPFENSGKTGIKALTLSGPVATSLNIEFDGEVCFAARKCLRDCARYRKGQPFFLNVSFGSPHDPYQSTPAFWDLYTDDEVGMPAQPSIPYDQQDSHSRQLYRHIGKVDWAPDDEMILRSRRGYYAAVSFVDYQVRRLLETLKECGFYDNTIIVFTSDHGDMLGEKGIWFKQTMYDQAVRVPLLFWGPNYVARGRTDGNVSLLHLFPTILDCAGIDPESRSGGHGPGGRLHQQNQPRSALAPRHPSRLGESLWPLVTGQSDKTLDCIYCEHTDANALSPILMVRRGKYKYVYSEKWGCQLFDMESDPGETENLIGDPELADERESLRQLVLSRWGDPRALHDRIVEDQNRRRLVWQSLTQGKRPVWDYQPFEDQTRRFVRSDAFLFDTEKNSILPCSDAR